MSLRTLYIALGDQLDAASLFDPAADRAQDAVWMAEVPAESRNSWSHQARSLYFLTAMRHFAESLQDQGWSVHYAQLGQHDHEDLAAALRHSLQALKPARVQLLRPGDWQVLQDLSAVLDHSGLEWMLREDPHFFSTPQAFARWAQGRKPFRMEHFYRAMRRRHDILLDPDGHPLGGRWNFDTDNRKAFGRTGPPPIPAPCAFPPDALTREAMADVKAHFPDHPGSLEAFDWPVTREQALIALDDFIRHRLPHFGDFQDAMWPDQPYLYHSRLSAAMNLHLLNPREVIEAALSALEADKAPLPAVEGFVRQILGWREFVRGLYWLRMPGWLDENHLDAQTPLPDFFWSGKTDMACLRDALKSTLELGYAHHIQRLMITGLYCLLLGVEPRQVHRWYLSVYVDAVEWVELPNTLGMSQFVDGGVLASKPYIASGAYIQRMGPYCRDCRFRPDQRVGDQACPFTTLYWDFLIRHEQRLADQPRLGLQLRNAARLDAQERHDIRQQAEALRRRQPLT